METQGIRSGNLSAALQTAADEADATALFRNVSIAYNESLLVVRNLSTVELIITKRAPTHSPTVTPVDRHTHSLSFSHACARALCAVTAAAHRDRPPRRRTCGHRPRTMMMRTGAT
jgi:hypothetical protein